MILCSIVIEQGKSQSRRLGEMRCSSCGCENREGAKFCNECGAPLPLRCPSCGTENRPGAKFCNECGASLTGGETGKREEISLESSVQRLESRQEVAERRQLTVMFCDLVGSTPLAEQLDPEELREVVRVYQEACTAVVHRFDGYIARYVGDALLVYFGYPVAHEDDAQRAVRAGLEIVGAIHELPLPPNIRLSQSLQVRIGIHTGLVVVGEMGGRDYRESMALGETPNIAARLQGLAAPDAVVMSAATHRLVEGFFACRNLGLRTLKGVSTPVEVHQVLGESGAQSRFEVAVTTGLTPLVGREREVGLLLERWEQAKEEAGQVVLLSGEAGIGKSRLVQVLEERAAGELHARLECRCSPYYQNSALYPLIDLLQRVLQFTREESPEEKLGKLERWLESYDFDLKDSVPLFASLLSLPTSHFPFPFLTPQKQKEKTRQAVLAWLLKEAEKEPLWLTVEDLHWADPSTLEFLGLLLDQAPTARIFVMLTFRPEFIPPWTSRSHLTPLVLSRLSRRQAEVMVTRVTGGKALPPEVLQQVVAKTDGVPLFVEELTKMVLESGLYVGATHASPSTLAIPATLQDSLMARLDRLGAVKEVAQLGSTLGREFPYELLRAVSSLDEETLQQGLARLVEAELLYRRGLPPQASYLFKHALIQEAAYQSLLKSKRQQYHQQIAQILEERFPETKETQPELLAHHYTEAGFIDQAISYWQQAGQRASQRSAHMEATAHLTKGLELLKTLPDTPERTQRELTLQIVLGATLIATKGYGAPEVERAYSRALELCRQVGETPRLFPVVMGLRVFHLVRGELQTARELAEQTMRLAQSVQGPAPLMRSHVALGETLYFLGEFVRAREHMEQGFTLYDPRQLRSPWAWVDDGMASLSYTASILWNLGYPDQALKRSREALTLAQELSYPYSLGFALFFAAKLHQYRREGQLTQKRAEATMTLSTDQRFPYWLAMGTILRGWALAEQGQGEEGIAQTRQGLAGYRATGAELAQPYFLALLAEAYGKGGQAEEGLSVLAEALDAVHKNGERFYEAELYRLKGTLTLQSSVQGLESRVQKEAEEYFHKAIEIARRQSAKSLELRAVVSLSRLWQQQGKKAEARQLLAEIYGWFTEGFDTADLRETRALLTELS